MAAVVATGVVAEVSTAAVALAAEDSPAADSVVAPTAFITVADMAMDAALTAEAIAEGTVPMAAATAEDTAPMVAAVPPEEYAAPLAPIMPGHPKVGAFATHRPAGIRLKGPVAAQPYPEDRVRRATDAA